MPRPQAGRRPSVRLPLCQPISVVALVTARHPLPCIIHCLLVYLFCSCPNFWHSHKGAFPIGCLLHQICPALRLPHLIGAQRALRLHISPKRGRHALNIHTLQLTKPLHDAL